MVAINDGIILEACIYRILKKHFGWVGGCRLAGRWLAGWLGRRPRLPPPSARSPARAASTAGATPATITATAAPCPASRCCCCRPLCCHPHCHPRPSAATRSALPCYTALLELFHEVTYQTAHGQLLDTTTAPIGTVRAGRGALQGQQNRGAAGCGCKHGCCAAAGHRRRAHRHGAEFMRWWQQGGCAAWAGAASAAPGAGR